MKKLRVLSVLFLFTIIVTGCGGEKTLTCTKSDDSTGMTMNQNIVTTFKSNKATKVDMSIDVVVDDQYKSQIGNIESSLKKQFSSYEEQKGVTFKTSTKDKTVNVNIVADLEKMDDAARKKLNITATDEKYDDVKEDFEDEGYSCK